MNAATQIVIAVISTGTLQWFLSYWRDRKREKDAAPSQIDASILTVARARDELEADNVNLRQTLREETARHAQERAEWAAERAALRREIAEMEAKLRAYLRELAALRSRHGLDEEDTA